MTGSELRERTCVVTGAAGVVGRAIAVALGSAGATVYEADPHGAEDAEGLARDLLARGGGIDFVVHSPGASSQDIDAPAACQLTQALLPGLCAKGGQVVFVSSTVALTATTAITALWNGLRRALNPHGVGVVSVYAPARLEQPEDIASAVLGALAPLLKP